MSNPIYIDKMLKHKSLKEFHHFLKDNEHEIMAYKKNTVFKSVEKGGAIPFISMDLHSGMDAEKARLSGFKAENIYPVINSTQWLDSHFDVHIKGCYKKTVKEQQGNVYLVDTHMHGLSNIITRKQHITMLVKDIDWKLLGKNIDGSTQCLVFEIPKLNVRPDALEFMTDTPDLENSLAMRYVNISAAIKSDDPYFKEENDTYKEYIGGVVNPEMAEKYGFFYVVKELAIRGEGSICPVVGGSNSATRNIDINIQPEKSTGGDNEPPQGTQKKVNFSINQFN